MITPSEGIKKYLDDFISGSYDILLKEVNDLTRLSVARFNGDGRLIGLVEKPKPLQVNTL